MIYEKGIPDLSSAREVKYRGKDGGEVAMTVYDRYFENPEIRFLGVFDTVGSFGLPGNKLNIGYNLSIPSNVGAVRHAVAADEYRRLFPLSSVLEYEGQPNDDRIQEVMFRGAHSDIGGGYQDDDQLSRIPLNWMWEEATSVGVPLMPLDPSVSGPTGEPAIQHDSRMLIDKFRQWRLRRAGKEDQRTVYYYPREP